MSSPLITSRSAPLLERQDFEPSSAPPALSSRELAVDQIARECLCQSPVEDGKMWKWCLSSAKQGNRDAQFCIAMKYDEQGGEECAKDAVRWYKQAAKQGHEKAQYNLGLCYLEGTGVQEHPHNLARAAFWLSEAARQGHSEAQFYLAMIYRVHGEQMKAVENPAEEAVSLLSQLAEENHAQAIYHLGICHENGYGIQENLDSALECYRRAASLGHEEAEERVRLLTPSQFN